MRALKLDLMLTCDCAVELLIIDMDSCNKSWVPHETESTVMRVGILGFTIWEKRSNQREKKST